MLYKINNANFIFQKLNNYNIITGYGSHNCFLISGVQSTLPSRAFYVFYRWTDDIYY